MLNNNNYIYYIVVYSYSNLGVILQSLFLIKISLTCIQSRTNIKTAYKYNECVTLERLSVNSKFKIKFNIYIVVYSDSNLGVI